MTMIRDIRVLTVALAMGAYMMLCTSHPVSAQAGLPWTLGTVDQSFVWSPQTNVVPSIDECANRIVKAQGPWTQTGSQTSPEQICLLRAMHVARASSKALAFTRWYYASSSDGESGFIDHFRKSRFGVVSIPSMEFPGRANNNWGYIFVNGTPAIINADKAFVETGSPWASNAAFLAIEKAHPNAWVFPQEDFVGESARPGGGQRFTIAAPIVDGCHACARIGIAYIAYDFGPLGSAGEVSVSAVNRCPSSDARCNHL